MDDCYGIEHTEMPEQEDGLLEGLEGFQLWVNLPSAHKMTQPRYQELEPAQIPEEALPKGGQVRVLLIAGQPIGEPVARQGPFVMNTSEELEQAYRDYHNGLFGTVEENK